MQTDEAVKQVCFTDASGEATTRRARCILYEACDDTPAWCERGAKPTNRSGSLSRLADLRLCLELSSMLIQDNRAAAL